MIQVKSLTCPVGVRKCAIHLYRNCWQLMVAGGTGAFFFSGVALRRCMCSSKSPPAHAWARNLIQLSGPHQIGRCECRKKNRWKEASQREREWDEGGGWKRVMEGKMVKIYYINIWNCQKEKFKSQCDSQRRTWLSVSIKLYLQNRLCLLEFSISYYILCRKTHLNKRLVSKHFFLYEQRGFALVSGRVSSSKAHNLPASISGVLWLQIRFSMLGKQFSLW